MNTYEVSANLRTFITITVTAENEDAARKAARVVLKYRDYDQEAEARDDFDIEDIELVSEEE